MQTEYLQIHHTPAGAADIEIQLSRNTFEGEFSILTSLGEAAANAPVRITAFANVFHPRIAFLQLRQLPRIKGGAVNLKPGQLNWSDKQNLYSADCRMLHGVTGETTMARWRQLCGSTEDDTKQGRIQFQRGELWAKASSDPVLLTPDHFRLHPESAGYHAGPDGKDLGADINLVGPGKAYERWKQTPEYAKWVATTEKVLAGAISEIDTESEN